MKRFSKIILSVSAVAAMAAAMAVSASAMTATYDDGNVTLSDVNGTGASQTMLVLDAVNLTTIADTNIKQIDQKDDGTSFGTFRVGTLADGTYEVRIGGTDGSVQTATFTVGGSAVETKDIIIGDINLNNSIAANDVTFMKRGFAEMTTGTGSYGQKYNKTDEGEIIIGDINLNGSIAANDVTFMKRGFAEMTTGTGSYGQTITVIAAE